MEVRRQALNTRWKDELPHILEKNNFYKYLEIINLGSLPFRLLTVTNSKISSAYSPAFYTWYKKLEVFASVAFFYAKDVLSELFFHLAGSQKSCCGRALIRRLARVS